MTYACTIRGCGATFAVPFEWYLHESSLLLHPYHFDIWYCGEDRQVGSPYWCKRGFRSEEDFVAHRARCHYDTYGDLDTDVYCLGPRHGSRYWCGFCREVFAVAQGRSWLHERFEHLRGHFTGEDLSGSPRPELCTIRDWEEIEIVVDCF